MPDGTKKRVTHPLFFSEFRYNDRIAVFEFGPRAAPVLARQPSRRAAGFSFRIRLMTALCQRAGRTLSKSRRGFLLTE